MFTDDRKLSAFVHSSRHEAEHPGYLALQPLVDLIELITSWFTGRRASRPSLPPRA